MASYQGRPLGALGDLAAFSFHETKNIQCGEGGALVMNDARWAERAEILWEKGTDRSKFTRGQVDKYTWVDVGSSFLPGEFTAAFLWAQLEAAAEITAARMALWQSYAQACGELRGRGTSSSLSSRQTARTTRISSGCCCRATCRAPTSSPA